MSDTFNLDTFLDREEARMNNYGKLTLPQLMELLEKYETREAEQAALNARLREALEELSQTYGSSVAHCRDVARAALSLTPSQALQGLKAQVLSGLDVITEQIGEWLEKQETANGICQINGLWVANIYAKLQVICERAAALEAEVKDHSDEA